MNVYQRRLFAVWWWCCSIVDVYLLMCDLELSIIRVLTFCGGREGG